MAAELKILEEKMILLLEFIESRCGLSEKMRATISPEIQQLASIQHYA